MEVVVVVTGMEVNKRSVVVVVFESGRVECLLAQPLSPLVLVYPLLTVPFPSALYTVFFTVLNMFIHPLLFTLLRVQ
mgnify:CR=1 FL=1